MRIGCGCGVIEPNYDNERSAHSYATRAEEARETAARYIANAERWEEIAKRYAGGGKACAPCEEAGGWQTPGDWDGPAGVSGWEVCSHCEGFGVTRALTCDDHANVGRRLREVRATLPKVRNAWARRYWARHCVW